MYVTNENLVPRVPFEITGHDCLETGVHVEQKGFANKYVGKNHSLAELT